MSDLISRQAAIDAICEDGTWLESQGCTEITMAERKQRDVDLLSELPSAEPASYQQVTGKLDCISRQAAIDAILNVPDHDDGMVFEALSHAQRDMALLPPSQPEIIRCKDCRYGVDYYNDGDCYCLNPKWGLMYSGGSWEFFCADAERRVNDDIRRES